MSALILPKEIKQRYTKIAKIPDGEWPNFERLIDQRSYKKGSQFCKAGEESFEFCIIYKGLFRLFYLDDDGNEYTKAFRSEGQIAAPYSELILGLPSRVTIEALENSEVGVVRHKAFTELYHRHPCWQELGRKIAEEHFISKEQRELEFMKCTAKERYLNFIRSHEHLKERIPQYLIASYIGVTPVAMSRILSAMKSGHDED